MTKAKSVLMVAGVMFLICSLQVIASPESVNSKFLTEILRNLENANVSSTPSLIQQGKIAVERKQYDQAKKYADTLKQSPMFSDYGYALEAQVFFLQAPFYLKKGQADKYLQSLERAKAAWLKIQELRPDSAWMSDLPEKLAECDLGMAQGYLLKREQVNALVAMDRALDRLNSGHVLRVIDIKSVKDYADICSRMFRTHACQVRVRDLAQLYPENSREFITIAKIFPDLKKRLRPRYDLARRIETYSENDQDLKVLVDASAAFVKGEYSDVVNLLNDFLEKYPNSSDLPRAYFLMARSYEKRGYRQEAFDYYEKLFQMVPLAYYGLVAAKALERDLTQYLSAESPLAETRDEFLNARDTQKLDHVEQFLQFDDRTLGGLELQSIPIRNEYSTEFLAYLAVLDHSAGNHSRAFTSITEILKRNPKALLLSSGLKMIFPMAFQKEIEGAAKDAGVDSLLMQSLVKQESSFDSVAVSRSGAVGLMQIKPTTALEVDPVLEIKNLYDYRRNLAIGTKYFAGLMKKYNNRSALALAAYNAGPQRVQEWLGRAREEWDIYDFIESIPFKETRQYVAAIIRNHYWYNYRQNNTKAFNPQMFWAKN